MSRHSPKEIQRIKRIAASADFVKPMNTKTLPPSPALVEALREFLNYNRNTMNTQHTPGPWRYFAIQPGQFQVASDSQPNIATSAWMGFEHEHNESNARLIAAAPSLLEALQWFSDFAHEHPEWEQDQFPADSPELDWLNQARAALALVKGENKL